MVDNTFNINFSRYNDYYVNPTDQLPVSWNFCDLGERPFFNNSNDLNGTYYQTPLEIAANYVFPSVYFTRIHDALNDNLNGSNYNSNDDENYINDEDSDNRNDHSLTISPVPGFMNYLNNLNPLHFRNPITHRTEDDEIDSETNLFENNAFHISDFLDEIPAPYVDQNPIPSDRLVPGWFRQQNIENDENQPNDQDGQVNNATENNDHDTNDPLRNDENAFNNFRTFFMNRLRERNDLNQQIIESLNLNITLTEADNQAISRLVEAGYERALVIQVYEACDKNEEAAMNLLVSMG